MIFLPLIPQGLVITEAKGKWDTYPVFCTPAHYLTPKGHRYPPRIRVTAQSLSIDSPSFPAYLLGLTLPGAPDPPFFLPWLSTATSPESPSSGTFCPWLTFFLCLSPRRLPVQCRFFFLHFVLFLVLDTQSFRVKANSGKKVINHLIN